MKNVLKKLFFTATAMLAICGCNSTPFAPVAVPEATSLRLTPAKNRIATVEELMALQRVLPPVYTIGPNDRFKLVVYGQPDLAREINVMPDGMVSIAPLGTLKLGGLSIAEANELVENKYRNYIRDCRVVLEPQTVNPYRFTIAGAVNAPGIYPFVFGAYRLSDTIATAKGFLTTGKQDETKASLADLVGAYILRKGKILPIDFTKALEGGDPLYNIPILDGDYIYIPSLESGKVTVLGELDDPDCIPFQPNLTLLKSIALCGGMKNTNARYIKVIRGGLNNPVVYTIDVEKTQSGQIRDFVLEPNDVVYIPRDGISEWNVVISKILPTIQLLNGLAGPFGSPSSFLYK